MSSLRNFRLEAMKFFSSTSPWMRSWSLTFETTSKFLITTLWVNISSLLRGYPFQDIAKVGLKFGDEGNRPCLSLTPLTDSIIPDLDEEEEKEQQKELTEQYKSLIEYLKKAASDVVRDGRIGSSCPLFQRLIILPVVISNRLVSSPCAVVADSFGYTANVQKMMSEYL